MAKKSPGKSGKKATAFRVGRVRVYLRGRVWYLCYHEHGKRKQPRVGPERETARQMAAEINAQLEVGIPSSLGFEPISIPDLRERWLEQHEHVRRSSLQTIRRYRTATAHLINFVSEECPVQKASDFRSTHAERFVRYLRSIRVAANGHKNTRKRPLRDCGIKYILETCSTMFNYAERHRHLPPYAENPFRAIEVGRIPIEDAKPIVVFDVDQERRLLAACDDWQFPIFLTLLLTGLRPGELAHLLLPNDLDLEGHWLFVRNKPQLGWQVKTRTEREIPLSRALAEVLSLAVGDRKTGPVFLQRRCSNGYLPPLVESAPKRLEKEMQRRIAGHESPMDSADGRLRHEAVAKTIWRDLGAIKADQIRKDFMRLTKSIGLEEVTAPKTLRHTFATCLQDANVDPLIRNELMGHSPGGSHKMGGLRMTATYTHTRPETKRRQLENALANRPAISLAKMWLELCKEKNCQTVRA